jgi:tRNA (cmo5U34)-methyltransferase
MSEFEESRWTNSEFSQNYRDEANIYLPFRREFIEITKSLYAYFFAAKSENNVLDLGCGDGLFIEELLRTFSPKSITLVDGSNEMLEAAQKRLGKKVNINFIQASFQSLLSNELLNQNYDFVYSSLAIHHLPLVEKKLLYSYIYKLLSPGGCFVHYDVVVPVSTKIENWFLSLWLQWIKEHPNKAISEKLLEIPYQYKKNADNQPDTLGSQLQALTQIGFKEVDCFFKHGIFSLFGGFK